uniref:Uncharacterized protein n=1 Tax=Anopheles braziliensis TaxID=58242 RepID=A0A2M3ZM87_9DIPT
MTRNITIIIIITITGAIGMVIASGTRSIRGKPLPVPCVIAMVSVKRRSVPTSVPRPAAAHHRRPLWGWAVEPLGVVPSPQ